MSKKFLEMQKIKNAPIARLIGAEMVLVEEGKAVFELHVIQKNMQILWGRSTVGFYAILPIWRWV